MNIKVEYPYYKVKGTNTIIDRSKITSISIHDKQVNIRMGGDVATTYCESEVEIELLLKDLMYKPN